MLYVLNRPIAGHLHHPLLRSSGHISLKRHNPHFPVWGTQVRAEQLEVTVLAVGFPNEAVCLVAACFHLGQDEPVFR